MNNPLLKQPQVDLPFAARRPTGPPSVCLHFLLPPMICYCPRGFPAEKKYFQVVKLFPCSLKEKKSLLRECIYQQVFNPSGLAEQTFTSHSYPTPKWGACGSFHTVVQGTRLLPSEEFLGPQSVPAEPLYPVSG